MRQRAHRAVQVGVQRSVSTSRSSCAGLLRGAHGPAGQLGAQRLDELGGHLRAEVGLQQRGLDVLPRLLVQLPGAEQAEQALAEAACGSGPAGRAAAPAAPPPGAMGSVGAAGAGAAAPLRDAGTVGAAGSVQAGRWARPGVWPVGCAVRRPRARPGSGARSRRGRTARGAVGAAAAAGAVGRRRAGRAGRRSVGGRRVGGRRGGGPARGQVRRVRWGRRRPVTRVAAPARRGPVHGRPVRGRPVRGRPVPAAGTGRSVPRSARDRWARASSGREVPRGARCRRARCRRRGRWLGRRVGDRTRREVETLVACGRSRRAGGGRCRSRPGASSSASCRLDPPARPQHQPHRDRDEHDRGDDRDDDPQVLRGHRPTLSCRRRPPHPGDAPSGSPAPPARRAGSGGSGSAGRARAAG